MTATISQTNVITDDQRAQAKRAAIATSVGNALEWFDIIVYASFAVVISKLFFPSADGVTGLVEAPERQPGSPGDASRNDWTLAVEGCQQGGLARAVVANEGDSLAASDLGGDGAHGERAVADRHLVEAEDDVGGGGASVMA